MGLTSSLFTGLTGMKTNEFRMDVIGNNISNVNTYGYKASRASFATQFYHTLSFGSAPAGALGGTNPVQIGTGSQVGGVLRDFSEGAPETTGIKTDMAVQGDGMFILERPDGGYTYTRDGSFQFNSENYLISADGYFLQGYSVDDNFNVVEGSLTPLRIPLGEITTAATSSYASFDGNLNANGAAAVDWDSTSGAYQLAGNGNIRTILYSQDLNDAGGNISSATLLTNLGNDATAADNGVFLEEGNIIKLDYAIKGGQTLSPRTFEVTATSTLGELVTWLEGVLGINSSSELMDLDNDGVEDTYDVDSDGTNDPPGIVLEGNKIRIIGNIGDHNELVLTNKAIKVEQGSAANEPIGDILPLTFAVPDGFVQDSVESVRTSFRAYDSLGNPMDIQITLAMQRKSNNGITWRYFAESAADTDTSRVLGTGTITFDSSGSYLEGSGLTIEVDRDYTGATTPQAIALDFSQMDGFQMKTSALSLLSQDGFQSGTLQDYSVGPDGSITGSFSNGLTRLLGQVVLATFRNPTGLIADAGNNYITGPDSGDAILKKPQEMSAGTINAAALELSNVDLSREFINLIITSTGFSASSRVIQTSDQLLTELMMLTR